MATPSSAYEWFVVLVMPMANGLVIGCVLGSVVDWFRNRINAAERPVIKPFRPKTPGWRHLLALLKQAPFPTYLKMEIRLAIAFTVAILFIALQTPFTWALYGQLEWQFSTMFSLVATAIAPAAVAITVYRLRRELLRHAFWTEQEMEAQALNLLVAEGEASTLERKTARAPKVADGSTRRL